MDALWCVCGSETKRDYENTIYPKHNYLNFSFGYTV